MSERSVRIVLVGLGNLGRRFAGILADKSSDVRRRYGLDLLLVGVADSRGTAYEPRGLDPALVARIKSANRPIHEYPQAGRRGSAALDLVQHAQADLLCEASPVNLSSGGDPGLSCIRAALARGMHVVTPNKGPIVLAYRELVLLAKERGVSLRFDGTVAGGLPALYLGMRDLRGALILRVEAVPNLSTGLILDQLALGISWDEALARGRAEGQLEADPTWDLDGWDAAAKLVILANAVLDVPASLQDVARTGITGVSLADIQEEARRGNTFRLVALAERCPDGSYHLSVAPRPLSLVHPLGRLGSRGMGIVYSTDIYGTIVATIEEPNPLPSAATMLRDILDIYVHD
jgi:homoserine dehydrogenase